MGAASMLTLLLTPPFEFRILLQYTLWHEPKRDISHPSEHATSGWDRPSMQRCWEFLDLTSRSFSGVVKELEGELARVVSFWTILLRSPWGTFRSNLFPNISTRGSTSQNAAEHAIPLQSRSEILGPLDCSF